MTAPSSSGNTDQARIDAQLTVRRVTGLSVGVAVVLIALKAFALGASGSVSILATLADSGLDLIASLATFYAVRWAAAPPDEAHRYGHGKAEALAALVQAGLVFASALFIGWAAVNRILDPRPVTAGSWSVGVMLISMALTGWLVWMQTRAVKASGSIAVAGDRAHYAADMAANLVALIGVASGAFLNAPGLDAAAGLVVAVWLFWGAAGMLQVAAQQLLDRAAPDEDRIAVTTAVLADPRISGVHQLRTRRAGPTLMVQMHVDLEPSLTLIQAHDIVVEAERRVLAVRPGADIIIHPDPRGRAETHTAAPDNAPATGFSAVASSPSATPPKGPWS